ncbi:hypothetical protein niasHT_025016 [Heterodera trifolii]|uniref:Hexosyltransferase n=1 Tax=Heterodera trifolii TaxID=157864 RepID=A0ABD2KSP8_9BILA
MGPNRLRFFLLICWTSVILLFIKFNNDSNNINKNNQVKIAFEQQKLSKKIGRESLFFDQIGEAEENLSKNKRQKQQKHFEIRFENIRLKFRMEFANACPPKPTLLILSMSRRNSFEKRSSIRRTWMNDALSGEVIRFLIADPSPGDGEAENVQQNLEDEQKRHGDLVFLHGFVDTYTNIHFKWYGGLQWQQSFCAGAQWVMKADDDSIVHLRRLAYWTEKKFRPIVEQNPLVYFGYVYYLKDPIRDANQKWHVPKAMYPEDNYPNFMQGTVYLTTPATVTAILSHSHEIVGFYLDDVVFTGILAKLANVTLSDQKWHFIFGTSFNEENSGCIDEMPSAFSMWGANNLADYENLYGKLKALKCK